MGAAMINENFIPNSTSKNKRPLDFPDCVHLTERCHCMALQVTECYGENCSFRKSADQYQADQRSWLQYMNSLTPERQKSIARLYYGGKMPWKDAE